MREAVVAGDAETARRAAENLRARLATLTSAARAAGGAAGKETAPSSPR
jgi:hypothetical protein